MKNINAKKWQEFLWKDNSGVALIEFALTLPVLLTLLFGAIEMTRYVQVNQRATIAAYAISDLITQNLALTDAEVISLLESGKVMMAPFPANAANLTVVVTSASKTGVDPAETQWQRSWPAGKVGISLVSDGEGEPVNVPGFTFKDRDQILAVEVFYKYRSMLGLSITDPFVPNVSSLYKFAFTRPRYGSLMAPAS